MRVGALVLLACAACGSGKDSDSVAPMEPATFTEIRDEILFTSCALSTCHSPGTQDAEESGLALDKNDPDAAYGLLVNATGASGKPLIVPNDVAGSFLLNKVQDLQGSDEGAPMPPVPGGLAASNPDMVARIVSWVENGAPDN